MANRDVLERQAAWARGSYLSVGVLPHGTPAEIDNLEAAITHWAKQLETAKWPRALGWFTNYAFLAGNHYPNFRWNETTLDWDDPKINQVPADSFIPKTADNRCIQPVQHNVSNLTRIKPEPRIRPNSPSPFDKDAANLGEALLSGVLWERIGVPEDLESAAHHLCCVGTVGIETIFDETDFPRMAPRMKKVRRKNDFTGEMESVEEPTDEEFVEFKRDVQTRGWTGFHLDVNPGATDDPKTHRWVMLSNYADIDELRDHYEKEEEYYLPDNCKRIPEDSSVASPLYWWERLKDLLDTPNGWYGLTTWPYNTAGGFAPNQTVFRVLDVKPTKYFPRGRTLVTAGGVLIYSGPSRAWHEDYPWRWHPYSFGRYWRVPGRFWGIPLMSELVPLQRRINAIDALLQINREYIGLGQWLIPRACNVPDGATSGLAGQEIRYTITPSGQKPERIKHEPLPSDLYNERAMVEVQMRELAGMQTSLQGKAPSGIRAAQMLEFMKNQMIEQQAPLYHNVERMIEGVAQNVLIEVAINYEEPDQELAALVRVAAGQGNHNLQSLDVFLGSDLRDNVHVKIDLVSTLLRSPEAKKELAIQFLQATPNMTRQERAIVAEILGFDEFSKQVSVQYERATSMVALIEQGVKEAFVPMVIDDAEIFADVFRTALASRRSRDLPPEAQDVLWQGYYHYDGQVQEAAARAFSGAVKQEYMLARARQGEPPQEPGEPAGEQSQVLSVVQGGAR